jgi:hypothetical protein
MNPISLRLNERLSSIPLLSDISKVLDQYYSQLDLNEDRTNYLYNTYNTFYNLTQTINHRYSEEELIIIANYIYMQKGEVNAIELFFKFFDIEYSNVSLNSDNYELNIEISNLSTNKFNEFKFYLKQFIEDLIIYSNPDDENAVLVVKINLNFTYTNDSNFHLMTSIINHIM